MKLNNKKIIKILVVCGIILVGVYVYSSYNRTPITDNSLSNTTINDSLPENKNSTPSASLKKDGVTDVFFGYFRSQIADNNSTLEPGQRFTVKVVENKKYPQIGNAKDLIIVNYPTANYAPGNAPSPSYVFYTKYDPDNSWYTILKLEAVNGFNSGGDQ